MLYRQKRLGLGDKDFDLIKSATMYEDSSNMVGGMITAVHDRRVLPFGRFLRRTKANGLPPLFNIPKVDMSFVGPRPQTRQHCSLFRAEQKKVIDAVGAGLTGVGSLFFGIEEQLLHDCGKSQDYFHDIVITPYKGDLEVWCSERKSVWLYLKIIYITAATMINRKLNVLQHFPTLPTPPDELLVTMTEEQGASL